MSPSWKVHSHRVAEPKEDSITCEPTMINWLEGYFSWGILLVSDTIDLPKARVGKWVVGGVLS